MCHSEVDSLIQLHGAKNVIERKILGGCVWIGLCQSPAKTARLPRFWQKGAARDVSG